ncbi:MAG: hypothetical protein JETT_0800 [Candidatus Jettenia ecosi]|uniref:Uncharacterized protein n=1 Tax=Candidatus Jettenia ecosi TaxID=2494326 RepID=A0A533QQM4_9BACT|nr:MAG: hypothetical protein JETT_0800 [Candidatus Jettenia ecosi]
MKPVKKAVLCFVSLTFCIIGINRLSENAVYAGAAGPVAYVTGAPGDTGTCSKVDCHNSFAVNTGTAKFKITSPPYIPGQYVTVKVSFAYPTDVSPAKKHGFEMTAVDASGKRVGSFQNISLYTQIIPPEDYRGLKLIHKNKYVEQTYTGISKKTWYVKYKAPSTATGPITFYASGVGADGNQNEKKDYTYKTKRMITKAP